MEYDMKLILAKTYGKGEKILLETERLILRELTYDDFKPLYAVLGDSDIMKHYPYIFDENKVRNWIEQNIERYRTGGFGLWAVVLKENGEMIGDCGITMQNINSQLLPEIGYHIRKDMQNRIPMQEPRCMMCMETSEGSLENIGGYVVYDMYYNA